MITIQDLRYRSLAIGHLCIPPGITSVIGRNGSGKTTLLRLLAGIAVPESGTILVDGIPPRDTGTGWVNEFPDRNILFGNTAEEIASPLRFGHLPCAVIEERVRSCMESLKIQALINRPMQELSGGEKVLVALAAALVSEPRVLVLDEYDSHLDADHCREIAGIIQQSRTRYVLHSTQDTEAAARGDFVIVLDRGTVICAGTPEDVFASLAGTAYYPLSWMCRV